MIPLSILDLAPITMGSTASDSFRASLDLARHAEAWGYKRFWMAEHHSMPGIASAATAVALAWIGAGTSTIRIGAGGIMLPNHAPLAIAEQFGTLESLFPGRVDLGLGRAPGTDQATAYALRRNLQSDEGQFPRDVVELMRYFQPAGPSRVRAVPGEGLNIPVWILGSSTFGAQLAAYLGLPFGFASHFAPGQLDEALRIYRTTFRPGQIDEPYVLCGFNVLAADTDEEARFLATSMQQSFVALRTGHPGPLPPPVEGYEASLGPSERAIISHISSLAAVGSPETVRAKMDAFIERTKADELMLTAHVFDPAKRLRSYEIVADLYLGKSADAAKEQAHG